MIRSSSSSSRSVKAYYNRPRHPRTITNSSRAYYVMFVEDEVLAALGACGRYVVLRSYLLSLCYTYVA